MPQDGPAVLHAAVKKGYNGVVQALLDVGVEKDAQDQVRGGSGRMVRAWESALMADSSGGG